MVALPEPGQTCHTKCVKFSFPSVSVLFQVEAEEEEWLEEEQSKMINDMMKKESDENQMKVFRKKQPSKTWDGGLKEKVEKEGGKGAPVGRSPGGLARVVVDKVKGVQEGEAELQRRKKLTVESEGKFYWKDADDHRKEEVPQETIPKFRKVQLHHLEVESNLVEQPYEQEDDDDRSKSSPESFLQQVTRLSNTCINNHFLAGDQSSQARACHSIHLPLISIPCHLLSGSSCPCCSCRCLLQVIDKQPTFALFNIDSLSS